MEKLTRVGRSTARLLNNLGIFKVADLIEYYPFRYDDFSQTVKIKDLKPYQTVTVKGKLSLISNRRAHRKRMVVTEALLEDETGSIQLIWFNQPFLTKNLRVGEEIYVSGRVDLSNLSLQFVSPAYEKASQDSVNTGKIVPVYPLTSRLTQKQLRFLINFALKSLPSLTDWLPDKILQKYSLMPLGQAVEEVHFPSNFAELAKARYRLKFNELFLIQAQNQLQKKFLEKNKAVKINFQQADIVKFVDSLPFKLTDDQKKAAWQIFLDLEKNQPMNRLLEGDVGSGKTVVAALAILNTVLNGYQAVLMAPTEILARQHYLSLQRFLAGFNLPLALFSRSERLISGEEDKVKKEDLIAQIKEGKIAVVIGTHALIQEELQYRNLGLVIIDEQHRFGVEQRKKLKEKNLTKKTPHFLSMTATPIPRSLALILYGDLDLTMIKEMPKGRKKIITQVVYEKNRTQAYDFIRQEIRQGRQVFVICPLIDPSDKLGVKSVKEEFKKLDKIVFPELEIALLHGKLKGAEKEKIMADFKANKTKILVSTSVIEVGIDIPNATIMMIECADRFGLAQLHQFRGRVGRGEAQSYCFLFSDNFSDKTRERLSALVNSSDGFSLAEYDLKFRGPGEVYGTRQSGLPDLKIASLNDLELINLTKEEAAEFLAENGLEDFPLLQEKLAGLKTINHLE